MEKGKISSLQMAMMMYPAIVATAILSVPSITAAYAEQDLWLSPILASLTGFATAYIAVRLHKLYPSQTVIQFSEQIIGRIPGKVLSFFILVYCIQSTGQITRAYGEFIVTFFLFKTPLIVIIASMVLLCAVVVYGGVEVLGRAAQLFFPVFVVPLILLIPLLSPNFEIGNILPILEGGMMPPIKGAIMPSAWFTEIFLILFFLPFLADREKGMKYGMITVFVVMITLVVVNLIVLFVLGITTASKEYPLMIASRYISYADFFENLDAVIMAIWIVGAFVKISVFYYVVALGTAQWLNLSDYRPIIWPIGILIVQFSFWSLPSTMEFSRYQNTALPFYANFIQVFIPLFLLVVAVVRKRKQIGSKTS
ncbi:GerAB/ArcD/ProY family transporter [Bacillus aerolatus]|uniref:GerAB/ArcD/ProY family transporter n=1 Tax=Bacillus aerolatus TaxID=2653354 RepID=A0A6I1FEK5_9BACI|nr:endospore germination permease [Bacillus aerolatus]KAB7706205.1 GerAB/ArcD/ProY family transporter [Bacillus aerolatus]